MIIVRRNHRDLFQKKRHFYYFKNLTEKVMISGKRLFVV